MRYVKKKKKRKKRKRKVKRNATGSWQTIITVINRQVNRFLIEEYRLFTSFYESEVNVNVVLSGVSNFASKL